MNWQHFVDLLRWEMASGVVGSSLARLVLAAILGGLIGLEREFKHRAAGLRTNMFICFGAAMFTLLSERLAGVPSDAARIAAQIIPGIGFIGAGSILHTRGLTTGLTTAATLFVVASVGMAAGGGLYLTAMFATGLVILALFFLGHVEETFNMKLLIIELRSDRRQRRRDQQRGQPHSRKPPSDDAEHALPATPASTSACSLMSRAATASKKNCCSN